MSNSETEDPEETHIRALGQLSSGQSGTGKSEQNQQFVVNYLYERLTIIDQKVSSILSLNSIILAAAAIIASEVLTDTAPPLAQCEQGILVVGGILWLISTCLSFSISLLKWEHLASETDADLDKYVTNICAVTTHRTGVYNLIVWLTGITFLAAAALITLRLLAHHGSHIPPPPSI